MAQSNPKKNYRYIGGSSNPKDKEFDHAKFDELVNNRQYQDAYDYAIQYPLLDPIEEAESMNDLKNMLREGRITETVYKNVDESAYPIIDFRNAVEIPGGIERLSGDNQYAKEFIEYKNSIGSGENRLKVTFEPQTQKLFGLDFLRKDNTEASIEKFYETTGYNKQYLEANGVKVGLKDGKPYLEFDKSNDLANTILLNINDKGGYNRYKGYAVGIQGVKKDGSLTDFDDFSWTFNSDLRTNEHPSNLLKMQRLYNSALKLEEKAYVEGTAKVKQYSSTFVPLMYENATELEQQLEEGKIKDSNFNSRIKRENEKLINGIAGIGVGEYEIQSAYFNDNEELVNRALDQEQQNEVLERYRGTKKQDIKYGISITGGKVGLTVILPPIEKTQTKPGAKSMRFTIFGDDIEKTLQRQINSDPKMQAYQEINDMQDLGYTYKAENGHTYTYDGLGGWIVDGKDRSKSKEYVIKEIHKDKACRDIGRDIVLNNLSVNGVIANYGRYYDNMNAASLIIANDIDKKVDIIAELKNLFPNGVDANNHKIDYTNSRSIAEAIFSLESSGHKVADKYMDDMSIDVYNKLNDIYDIRETMRNSSMRYVTSYVK